MIVDCVTSMETTFTRARECRLRVAAFDRRTAATLRGAAPSFHRGFELDALRVVDPGQRPLQVGHHRRHVTTCADHGS